MNTSFTYSRASHLFLKISSLLFLTAAAIAMVAGPAQAAVTLDVRQSGGTYNSIQDAISAAPITADTVTIRIAKGLYNEYVYFSDAANITIEGGWNSTFTSRDTNNRATVVRQFDITDSTAALDGLTVDGADDVSPVDLEDSNVTMRHVRVVNGAEDYNGGGIEADPNLSLSIYDSEIANNVIHDDNGGGLEVTGGTLLIKNTSIHDNMLLDDAYNGGGIYLEDVTATIEGSRILRNSTRDTDDYNGPGGGIYAENSYLSIVNSLVANNYSVDEPGGGIYYRVYDPYSAYASSGDIKRGLQIVNSTIAGNFTDGDSNGGVDINWDLDEAGTIKILNSILWGNKEESATAPFHQSSDLNIYAGYGWTPTIDISYSDIGASTGAAWTGTGNTSSDPMFVDAINEDYRLATGSPAIDTATSVGAPAIDIEGILRPQWAGFDRGAFENHAPATTLATPYISSTVRRSLDFDVSWTGSDPSHSSSGLLFDVWYKIGVSGGWQRWLDWTATTGRRFHGRLGKTYYFKAKAKDAAGNVGAFSAEKTTLVPFDGLRGKYIVSRHGFRLNKWGKKSMTSYSRTLRMSSAKGEQITYKYKKTNQINLIANLGPGHGKFKVLVDGVSKGTVDTKAATTKKRQVVFTVDFASFGTHKIQVVNLGTPGRPTIEMDGIAVRR